MFVRPSMDKRRPGKRLLVRDPISLKFLKEEGEEKPKSVYWLRALKSGDVEPAPAPAKSPALKPEKK